MDNEADRRMVPNRFRVRFFDQLRLMNMTGEVEACYAGVW